MDRPAGDGGPPPAHLPSLLNHEPLQFELWASSVSRIDAHAEVSTLHREAEVLM